MSDSIVKREEVGALYRQATDVAGVCGAIVRQTARQIGPKRYVQVEGWQAIATTYGCIASARDVEAVAGGIRAIGEVRRMADGAVLATAEGFVGDDEPTWAKRPMYARRAMAQTRAISRACRSAFAFVVVLIDANLSTTPAEEVPEGGFDSMPPPPAPSPRAAEAVARVIDAQPMGAPTRLTGIAVPFGRDKGKDLSQLDGRALSSLADYLRKQVEDVNKASFREGNQRLLDAVVAEATARKT